MTLRDYTRGFARSQQRWGSLVFWLSGVLGAALVSGPVLAPLSRAVRHYPDASQALLKPGGILLLDAGRAAAGAVAAQLGNSLALLVTWAVLAFVPLTAVLLLLRGDDHAAPGRLSAESFGAGMVRGVPRQLALSLVGALVATAMVLAWVLLFSLLASLLGSSVNEQRDDIISAVALLPLLLGIALCRPWLDACRVAQCQQQSLLDGLATGYRLVRERFRRVVWRWLLLSGAGVGCMLFALHVSARLALTVPGGVGTALSVAAAQLGYALLVALRLAWLSWLTATLERSYAGAAQRAF